MSSKDLKSNFDSWESKDPTVKAPTEPAGGDNLSGDGTSTGVKDSDEQKMIEKQPEEDQESSEQLQIGDTSLDNEESIGHNHSEESTEHQKTEIPPIIEESPPSAAAHLHHHEQERVTERESASLSQTGLELPRAMSTTQRDSLVSSSQNILSASSSTRLDWTMTLTPKERSCINLINIEPCVNKAVGNLESLLDVLANKLDGEPELRPSSKFLSRTPPSPIRPVSFRLSALGRKRRDSELSVEGIPTGTTVERLRRHSLVKKVSGYHNVMRPYLIVALSAVNF